MDTRNENAIFNLCDRLRQVAFDLHVHLKHGYMKKVYENGLAHRLRKDGLQVEQQKSLWVYDEDGTILGDYRADLLIEGCIIIELKVCKTLSDKHIAHVMGYLRASKHRDAMLINFGSPRLQIRKFILRLIYSLYQLSKRPFKALSL